MRRRAFRGTALALVIGIVLAIAACGSSDDPASPASSSSDTDRPAAANVEPAPELAAIEGWHNTEPLTLAGLHGSTILLVFFSDT